MGLVTVRRYYNFTDSQDPRILKLCPQSGRKAGQQGKNFKFFYGRSEASGSGRLRHKAGRSEANLMLPASCLSSH